MILDHIQWLGIDCASPYFIYAFLGKCAPLGQKGIINSDIRVTVLPASMCPKNEHIVYATDSLINNVSTDLIESSRLLRPSIVRSFGDKDKNPFFGNRIGYYHGVDRHATNLLDILRKPCNDSRPSIKCKCTFVACSATGSDHLVPQTSYILSASLGIVRGTHYYLMM